jgi:hypothetical protein
MADPKVAVRLTAVDDASPALKAVAKSADQAAASVDRTTSGLASFAKAAAALPVVLNQGLDLLRKVGGAGAALGRSLFGLAKTASASGDAFFVLSDKLGVSSESLSRLAFAAKQNGASFGDLQLGLQVLAQRAQRTPKAFAAIGVSVRDAGGAVKSADVLFRDVAEAISRLPPGAARVAAAQALMSQGGRALVPVLQQGAAGVDALAARADALGVTLSTRASVQANAFGNELAAMADAAESLQRTIGLVAMPAITTSMRAAQDAIGEVSSAVNGNLEGMQRDAMAAAATVVGAVAAIVEAGLSAADIIQGITRASDAMAAAFDRADAATRGGLSAGLRAVANTLTFGMVGGAKAAGDAVGTAAEIVADFGRGADEGDKAGQRLVDTLRALQATLAAGDVGGTVATAAKGAAGAADVAAQGVAALQDAHVQAREEAVKAEAAQLQADLASFARRTKLAEAHAAAEQGRRDLSLANLQRAAEQEDRVLAAQQAAAQGRLDAIKGGVDSLTAAVAGTATNAVGRLFDSLSSGAADAGQVLADLVSSLPRVFAEATAAYLVQLGVQKAATAAYEAFRVSTSAAGSAAVVAIKVAETKTKVAAEAAAGGAAAVAAHAGIPFVGKVIGLAAAGAIVAAIVALAGVFASGGGRKGGSKPSGAREGGPQGFALGGMPAAGGLDSVLALINPGERVLSGPETRALAAGHVPAVVGGTSTTRQRGAREGARGMVIEQRLVLEALPDRTAVERYRRDVVAVADRRMRRRGA